jgi:hypothetical protein
VSIGLAPCSLVHDQMAGDQPASIPLHIDSLVVYVPRSLHGAIGEQLPGPRGSASNHNDAFAHRSHVVKFVLGDAGRYTVTVENVFEKQSNLGTTYTTGSKCVRPVGIFGISTHCQLGIEFPPSLTPVVRRFGNLCGVRGSQR